MAKKSAARASAPQLGGASCPTDRAPTHCGSNAGGGRSPRECAAEDTAHRRFAARRMTRPDSDSATRSEPRARLWRAASRRAPSRVVRSSEWSSESGLRPGRCAARVVGRQPSWQGGRGPAGQADDRVEAEIGHDVLGTAALRDLLAAQAPHPGPPPVAASRAGLVEPVKAPDLLDQVRLAARRRSGGGPEPRPRERRPERSDPKPSRSRWALASAGSICVPEQRLGPSRPQASACAAGAARPARRWCRERAAPRRAPAELRRDPLGADGELRMELLLEPGGGVGAQGQRREVRRMLTPFQVATPGRTRAVESETSETSPPMIPAIPVGPSRSRRARTRRRRCARPRRGGHLLAVARRANDDLAAGTWSRSNACSGWPVISIT